MAVERLGQALHHRSAPSSSGRQRIGEANVLSMSRARVLPVSDFGQRRDIGNFQQRIGDRLGQDQLRVRSNGRLDRRQVARIDGRRFDSQPLGLAAKERQRLAIQAAADDGVVARAAGAREAPRPAPHAGSGDDAALRRVQLAELFGQQDGIGMAVALIDVARFAAGQQVVGLLRALAGPDAGRIDRRRVRLRRQRRQGLRAGAEIGGLGHSMLKYEMLN